MTISAIQANNVFNQQYSAIKSNKQNYTKANMNAGKQIQFGAGGKIVANVLGGTAVAAMLSFVGGIVTMFWGKASGSTETMNWGEGFFIGGAVPIALMLIAGTILSASKVFSRNPSPLVRHI